MKDIPERLEEVTPDELPSPHSVIAASTGVKAALTLSRAYGGTTVYISKQDSIIRMIRHARIRKEFTGFNRHELARKYGLSAVQITNITKPE